MNVSSVFSTVPGNLAIYFVTALLTCGGLVWYALRIKGDVRAVFSHGNTTVELEAKERRSKRDEIVE